MRGVLVGAKAAKVRTLPTARLAKAVPVSQLDNPVAHLPGYGWTCHDFLNGRSITWRMRGGMLTFQVSGAEEYQTQETHYPPAAAIARTLYGVPPIGCLSLGPIPE